MQAHLMIPTQMITKLLFLFLTIGVLYAGDPDAPPRTIHVSINDFSPLQTFYIEQHTLSPNEVRQVWLVSTENPKKRNLLYTHSRSVQVLFSEDEHWLVVNDYGGSDFANVLVFRQRHGTEYKQVEDITTKAWEFLATREGRINTKQLPLDHYYAEVLRWTDDHTFLLCLHGHLDKRNHVEDWLCFYDVNSKVFSTDLDKHNKQHTTLAPE